MMSTINLLSVLLPVLLILTLTKCTFGGKYSCYSCTGLLGYDGDITCTQPSNITPTKKDCTACYSMTEELNPYSRYIQRGCLNRTDSPTTGCLQTNGRQKTCFCSDADNCNNMDFLKSVVDPQGMVLGSQDDINNNNIDCYYCYEGYGSNCDYVKYSGIQTIRCSGACFYQLMKPPYFSRRADGQPIMRGCTFNPDDRKKGNYTVNMNYTYASSTFGGIETMLCNSNRCNNFEWPRESAMSIRSSVKLCLLGFLLSNLPFLSQSFSL